MESRIPAYDSANPDGMLTWFAEMSARGLLFHPEEDPAEILRIGTWERTFTDAEADRVRGILCNMFAQHGDETISACCPVFMRAVGQRLDA
ncbi:hypothetical protein [Thermomonas sp.]|uniref:hypothetical protein n=1 Tax=Thermomonas sp. TaxID=1971895 RepID=UPI0024897568|nr:hypothetical protein [Thermomonas sp.]MDI1251823.1 hypothetical protein [Thermomonas sp.]